MLIHQLKQQEDLAFRELFDQYASLVYNTALNFVQNQEDAEDIAQEVFVDISDKIKGFKEESSLKTWLYRITCNKALEQIRKSKRKKRFGIMVSIDSDRDIANEDNNEKIEKEEKLQVLHQLIDDLPENQRMAFSLHHLEGLSYEEIAEVMETSISAVESLLFRAKNSLKKKVALLNERG